MTDFLRRIGLAMILSLVCMTGNAQPPSFRVDTDIYVGEAKEPVKQNQTLFSEGVYYDFALDDSSAITIIDPARGRIILLNPKREMKTTLQTALLLTTLAQAREEASQQSADSELARILKAAEKSSYDPDRQVLLVGDESLQYEASLIQPQEAAMASQYAEFADWSARLNAVYPPHFIPFVRLELNKQIASRSMLPKTITRTEKHDRKQSTVRSRLLVNGRISSDDEESLRHVGKLLATCKEVTAQQYFEPAPRLANPTGAKTSR